MKKPVCQPTPFCRLLYINTGKLRLEGVYKLLVGNRQGQQVWIVDGDKIWSEIYPAFVMGGNDQRYRFNPPGDVQIDDGIGIEELNYTLEHELRERYLMLTFGWTYARAHDNALKLEKDLRTRDGKQAARQNRKRAKELNGHPVYRQRYGTVDGVAIWLVDGPMVREFFDGNFCFADHGGRKDNVIPTDEVWLDSSMGVVRGLLSLTQALEERDWMLKGHTYEDAYPMGLAAKRAMLERHRQLARKHEAKLKPVTHGTRERGVPAKAPVKAQSRHQHLRIQRPRPRRE